MRYVAKTTSKGYSFVFRNVLEFKFSAPEGFLSVQLEGRKINLNGVTSFEGGGDFEPHLPSFAMIPPKLDGEEAEEEKPAEPEEEEESESSGFEFPREPSVPIELAMTTFAPLERYEEGKEKSKDLQDLFDAETVVADGAFVNTRGMTGSQLRDLVSASSLVTFDGKIFKSSKRYVDSLNSVFPSRLGADDTAVKRLEGAIRESDFRFRNAVVSTMADARKRGMVLN